MGGGSDGLVSVGLTIAGLRTAGVGCADTPPEVPIIPARAIGSRRRVLILIDPTPLADARLDVMIAKQDAGTPSQWRRRNSCRPTLNCQAQLATSHRAIVPRRGISTGPPPTRR